MIIKIKYLISLIILLSGYYLFSLGYKNISFEKKNFNKIANNSFKDEKVNKNDIKKQDEDVKKSKINEKIINDLKELQIKVKKNQTFSSIVKKYLNSNELIFTITSKIEEYYDLKKLREKQIIYFYFDIDNKLKKIILPIDKNIDLNIYISDVIDIKKNILKTTISKFSQEFIIYDSLYSDGIKNNIPSEILIKLIRLYSFDLDFQRDIRKNTKVSVSYEAKTIEERNETFYDDIIYSLIQIEKNKLEYFKFITDDGYIDYFNRKGENVKKSLLKTPLDGAKLSSKYGMRKHPISGYNKMHKGVDFAAPMGTPIYAGGNGIIEFVGRNGGYGKYIRIRHNNEYKTAYAHLSKYKKGIHKGFRVNQGDVIGYVGNTGNSTGPHLHYEIIFQNKQINPFTLKLPSGKKLKGKELEKFTKEMKLIYANHLNLLFE